MPEAAPSQLEPFPETGKPKGSRLKDKASLDSIYWQMRSDDSLSAQQRAGIRAMVDGAKPYKESARRKSGTAGASNLNFGEASARLNQTLTAYNEMMDSVRTVIEPQIPIDVYDDSVRQNAEEVIADEFTTMLRDWNGFDSRFQLLAKEFIEHGVSLGYFPDDFDWKFDACGWDNFLIPRDTRAEEKHIQILLQVKDETPSELYRMIQNEAAAKQVGWNVEEVKKALVKATRFAGKQMPSAWGLEWELLTRSMKDNDLFASFSSNARVFLLHAWVCEYDGTWSHYISVRDPQGSPKPTAAGDFLYQKTGRFPKNADCFTVFCLNIGNGYYHSIRGQGYQMYPFVQTSNKMRNDLVNLFRSDTAMIIQKKDSNQLDENPIVISAGMGILSPEVTLVERQQRNHAQGVLPILHDFSTMMDGVAPVGRGQEVAPGSSVMTKYQIQGQQLSGNALSNSSQNMFFRSLRRLLREKFRRVQEIIKSKRTEFSEVMEFAMRCERRGVPADMILAVERVYEVRAIGAGSPGARQATIDRMLQRIGTMDEVGRARLLHDASVADVGVRAALRYVPLNTPNRPVADQKIALMENAEMFKGASIPPLQGENHAVHALVHVGDAQSGPSIANSVQVLEDWRNGGEQGDITDLQPHVEYLSLLIPHTEQHVQAMSADPTRAEEAANMRKGLQEYAAIWMTYVRQLQKALDEQEAEAGEAGAQPDPVQLAKVQAIQAKLEMDIRRFQSAEQLKVADVSSRMALRKREADTKMAILIAKANAEKLAKIPFGDPMSQPLPPASQSDDVTNRNVRTPMNA